MKKLTILCDMDGIAADILSHWLKEINLKYNKSITKADVTNWDIGKLPETQDIGHKVYKMIKEPMFFWDLEPTPGSINALTDIKRQGHDVYFLTAPAGYESAREKIMWVDKYFPKIGSKNMILTHHKDLVKGDVFIDDKPSAIEEYAAKYPDALVMTFEYPYNSYLKNHPTIKTVGSWSDIATAWDNVRKEIDKKANENECTPTFTDRPINCS